MTLVAPRRSATRECDGCYRPARATETIVFRGRATRIRCCTSDQMSLAADVYSWTQSTSGASCTWCGGPVGDEPVEEVTFRGTTRYAVVCSACQPRLEISIYKWTRLGETITQTDDLARRAERARVVRSHAPVIPEKLAKPVGVDRRADQAQLNRVWTSWRWRGHAIERLVERGLSQIEGFEIRDVISAIAFGTRTDGAGTRVAKEMGLDLGLENRKRFHGQRCVVVGDIATRDIITVWARDLDKET
jgi:hypothetical protein